MDQHFTIMIIPEREKGVKSFRVPKIFFQALIIISTISLMLFLILGYDYWKILRQVYENKHLATENRELKEQIQLFQMKINTLSADIKRIHTFEKKLRIITGLDNNKSMQRKIVQNENPIDRRPNSFNAAHSLQQNSQTELTTRSSTISQETPNKDVFETFFNHKSIEKQSEFKKLKNLYEQKIATTFGLQTSYLYTKDWSDLTKQSFAMASQFAKFDYQFSKLRSIVKNLEVNIHKLDQYLLDRDSFIKSIPTLLPTKGWITSYFGHRPSPYSGVKKMHEGLDIGAKIGTPIVAPADGIVTYSGKKPGFGILVQLDHGYGIESIYAHNKKSKVRKGQIVRRGTLIAQVGSTGLSTGPHLHYEIRINGTPVDPLYYILD